MTESDKRLREALKRLLDLHFDEIEAILPESSRRDLRRIVNNVRQHRGPKPHVDDALLLVMAELEHNHPAAPRALAAQAIARFRRVDGASNDERPHVALPDGSRPAAKDLIDRLSKKYTERRAALIHEVECGQRIKVSVEKRREEITRRGGISIPLPTCRPLSPEEKQHWRTVVRPGGHQRPTGYLNDIALGAVLNRSRKR
jgi:hypothetical protein